MVTPCIMHELRSLGPGVEIPHHFHPTSLLSDPLVPPALPRRDEEFEGTVALARQRQLHYCGHGRAGRPSAQREGHEAGGGGRGRGRGGEDDGREEAEGSAGDAEASAGTQTPPPGRMAAADCILSQVGESAIDRVGGDLEKNRVHCCPHPAGDKNRQHWWVATQDRALRSRLEELPGTPIVFATINGVQLDTPSEMVRAAAKKVMSRSILISLNVALSRDFLRRSLSLVLNRLPLAPQAEEASTSLPGHERLSDALKDLEQIRPKLKTSARFRLNKAKVRGRGADPSILS